MGFLESPTNLGTAPLSSGRGANASAYAGGGYAYPGSDYAYPYSVPGGYSAASMSEASGYAGMPYGGATPYDPSYAAHAAYGTAHHADVYGMPQSAGESGTHYQLTNFRAL